MKKFKLKKMAGVALAGVMATSMIAGVGAANYTPVSGTANGCTFEKYLVVKKDSPVPAETFSFSIAPGTAVAAEDGDHFDIRAGVGSPTIAPVTFGSGDTKAAESTKGSKSIVFATTDNTTDEEFATKTVAVDFSSVSFSEPGVYRYVISETVPAAAATGVTYDTTAKYLDVFVENEMTEGANPTPTGNLVISEYVLHTSTTLPDTSTGGRVADKVTGFSNRVSSQNISYGVDTTGNQASKDKYFKTTVKVEGLNPDSVYTVNLTGNKTVTTPTDATTYTGETITTANNVTTLTGAELAAGHDFYLQPGQSVELVGVEQGANYEIVAVPENYNDDTDYTGQPDGNSTAHKLSGTVSEDGVDKSFVMSRSGTIPTGVAMAVGPSAALALAGAAGLVGINAKRRRRND